MARLSRPNRLTILGLLAAFSALGIFVYNRSQAARMFDHHTRWQQATDSLESSGMEGFNVLDLDCIKTQALCHPVGSGYLSSDIGPNGHRYRVTKALETVQKGPFLTLKPDTDYNVILTWRNDYEGLGFDNNGLIPYTNGHGADLHFSFRVRAYGKNDGIFAGNLRSEEYYDAYRNNGQHGDWHTAGLTFRTLPSDALGKLEVVYSFDIYISGDKGVMMNIEDLNLYPSPDPCENTSLQKYCTKPCDDARQAAVDRGAGDAVDTTEKSTGKSCRNLFSMLRNELSPVAFASHQNIAIKFKGASSAQKVSEPF